jgi:hypothetical protein
LEGTVAKEQINGIIDSLISRSAVDSPMDPRDSVNLAESEWRVLKGDKNGWREKELASLLRKYLEDENGSIPALHHDLCRLLGTNAELVINALIDGISSAPGEAPRLTLDELLADAKSIWLSGPATTPQNAGEQFQAIVITLGNLSSSGPDLTSAISSAGHPGPQEPPPARQPGPGETTSGAWPLVRQIFHINFLE